MQMALKTSPITPFQGPPIHPKWLFRSSCGSWRLGPRSAEEGLAGILECSQCAPGTWSNCDAKIRLFPEGSKDSYYQVFLVPKTIFRTQHSVICMISEPCNKAPSVSITPTLGPIVHKYDLLWAIWSPRVRVQSTQT